MSNSYFGYVFMETPRSLEVVDSHNRGRVDRKGRPPFSAGDWRKYEFESMEAIYSGDETKAGINGPPYTYEIIAVQREEFAIIAAEARGIIDVLSEGLWKQIGLKRYGISVHALVINIIENKFKMEEGTGMRLVPCVTFLNAKTTGYIPRVEWASFHGRDLSVAKMITDQKGKVLFNRCGLRVPSEKFERAKLSFDGAIDFHRNALHAGATRDGGTHLEELILTLKREGYLQGEDDVSTGTR